MQTLWGRGRVCRRVRTLQDLRYRASWFCCGPGGIWWYQDGFWKRDKMAVPSLLLHAQKVPSFDGPGDRKQEGEKQKHRKASAKAGFPVCFKPVWTGGGSL